MKTASFAVNLSSRDTDETFMAWDRKVAILGARAILVQPLEGSAPLWIHVESAGHRLSFVFHPPLFEGARRVTGVGFDLPKREQLRIWAVRAGGGGVLRVEVDYEAPPRREKARAEQALRAAP